VIDTSDNVRTIVGNSKILGDTIQNFFASPYRRVDVTAQLHHRVDPADAITRLRERIASIPNVAKTPPPEIEILQFTRAGAVLAVRPCCHNDAYLQVYFDTNRAIRDTLTGAGYPTPEQLVVMRGGTPG
jgi:small conductance mechanosensitive channel